jgi:hypothetical protein
LIGQIFLCLALASCIVGTNLKRHHMSVLLAFLMSLALSPWEDELASPEVLSSLAAAMTRATTYTTSLMTAHGTLLLSDVQASDRSDFLGSHSRSRSF